MCVTDTERQRQRKRQTETETERQTDRQRDNESEETGKLFREGVKKERQESKNPERRSRIEMDESKKQVFLYPDWQCN